MSTDRESSAIENPPSAIDRAHEQQGSGETVSFEEGSKGPTYKDLGGLKDVVDKLETLVFSLCNVEAAKRLGADRFRAILLHGPPGCGKTTLGQAMANELPACGVSFYMRASSELVSVNSVEKLFSDAHANAPSIIFIDDIDKIGKREDSFIVTRLVKCMDHCRSMVSCPIVVIGATNRPDTLDPKLRKTCFPVYDDILVGVPDNKAKEKVLYLATRKHSLSLESSFDTAKILSQTSGFVGADFHALAMEVASRGGVEKNLFTTLDFMEALEVIQPTLVKEGYFTKPQEKLSAVVGVDHLLADFSKYIIRRLKSPDYFKQLGLLSKPVLLYGPGCGKSLLAKAIANEAGACFVHANCKELIEDGGEELIGEALQATLKAVTELFTRASMGSPCLVFIDEVDLVTRTHTAFVDLLVDLCAEKDGVICIAATSRPELMDDRIFERQVRVYEDMFTDRGVMD